MPETTEKPIKDLCLDLKNFRTVAQRNESQAIETMIATSPDWFWALTSSLLDDGYLPTENIIVLKDDKLGNKLVVKEGNRRIAALKLIHGFVASNQFNIPEDILEKIKAVSESWKRDNNKVPCAIYLPKDRKTVDRIVTLAHGKGEKAGRDKWNAIARARHSRDENKASESGLDLLEKYFKKGENVQRDQARRWAGQYPLTVLNEALKRIAPRLEFASAPLLSKKYPEVPRKKALDNIVKDIGLELLTFKKIRDEEDFLLNYGFPPLKSSAETGGRDTKKSSAQDEQSKDTNNSHRDSKEEKPDSKSKGEDEQSGFRDPKSVTNALKKLSISGAGREKVVDLRDEAARLNLKHNPIAFCFLVRSMFEISAKAYCKDHKADGLSSKKSDGNDKFLATLLREITAHLTQRGNDKAMVKALHGPLTELAKSDGILSVTSMNQLVHNPDFSIASHDISVMFGNILPLLKAMNSK